MNARCFPLLYPIPEALPRPIRCEPNESIVQVVLGQSSGLTRIDYRA